MFHAYTFLRVAYNFYLDILKRRLYTAFERYNRRLPRRHYEILESCKNVSSGACVYIKEIWKIAS